MAIKLTDEQGKFLLEIARKAISHELNLDVKEKTESDSHLKNSIPDQKRGTFVTLQKNNNLRGCIGTLEPLDNIIEGIQHNAKNAAFKDHRFPPIEKNELNKIRLEISILTKPVKLHYNSVEALLDHLKPFVHGVIIAKGFHKATFLPQVWEQLTDKNAFLSNLCSKAGLPSSEWTKGELDVMTYNIQCFKEK